MSVRTVAIAASVCAFVFAMLAFGLSAEWVDGGMARLWLLGCLVFFVSALALLAWIVFRRGVQRGTARLGVRPAITGGIVVLSLATAIAVAGFNSNPIWAIFLGVPLAVIVLFAGSYAAGVAKAAGVRSARLGYTASAWMALPASALWIWYMFAGPGYYAEFNRIKADLAEIPGIEVLEVRGHRDLTFEDISARLSIPGKGEINVIGLTRAALRDVPNLYVSKFGPYSFRNQRWGYGSVIDREGKPVWHESVGFALNFGRNGDFASGGRFAGRIPSTARNVQDLIARYDEICAVLAAMQQEKLFFRNPDGSTNEYTIRSDRSQEVAAAAGI